MIAHDILDHKVYPQVENKENMLSCPSLLAMHHGRLSKREHSTKKNPHRQHTKKNKVNKSQCVKHLSACVKVIESALCGYRIYYGRVISPWTADRTFDKC